MKPLLTNGATILLTPDPGWNWSGWDGQLKVFSTIHPMAITSNDVIIEPDVPKFTLISPRSYTAVGFSDVPGIIQLANFFVDEPTLSKKIRISNFAPLLISTTGRFTCTYMMPSQKITPVGPVPDLLVMKTGTWKAVNPNQQVVFKNPFVVDPCNDADVTNMSHEDKMVAAINQSGIGGVAQAALEELGGAIGIAKSLGTGAAIGIGIGVIALLPFEGAALAVTALTTAVLAAGAALSGYEIGKGINSMVDFYKKTDAAKSCPEIGDAANSFADGVAKMGIGGLGAVLSVRGARVKTGSKMSLAESPNPQKVNILEAELKGGHSIERHGAQLKMEDMQQRVLGTHPTMPQSRSAMKFDNELVHQEAVNKAYEFHKVEIDEHFAKGGGYKEWEYDYGKQVGTGYTNTGTRGNPQAVSVTTTKVKIAIKPGEDSYILDSAYPSFP